MLPITIFNYNSLNINILRNFLCPVVVLLFLEKNMKEECPYNSVTIYHPVDQETAIYHPVDQETARVEVGDEHTVELPNGDYEITRQHNFKMCTFYILVRSQELYIGY